MCPFLIARRTYIFRKETFSFKRKEVVYNITADSLTHPNLFKDISDSVQPNTKTANITILNQHNNGTYANKLNAAHYFSDTETLVGL